MSYFSICHSFVLITPSMNFFIIVILFRFALVLPESDKRITPMQDDTLTKISSSNFVKFVNLSTCISLEVQDTGKIPDKYYVVAGSFLIPKNAEKQLQNLQKIGFAKCYIYNFPGSEFYSVVVDTFKNPDLIPDLKKQLEDLKIANFTKSE